MILKLTAALAACFGATTPEMFSAGLAEFITKATAFFTANADTAKNLTALETSFGTLKAELKTASDTITAQATEIKDLKAKVGDPATLTEARIKEIALAGGKEGAISAVAGAAAGSPVAAAPAKPADTTTTAKLNEQGKFIDAWKGDKNLQAEFPTAKSYEAYMKAFASGAVQLKDDK